MGGPPHGRVRLEAGPAEHPGRVGIELASDLQGSGRGRRDHRSLELPLPAHRPEVGRRPGHGQLRGRQAGARHPLERNSPREADRREDRHSARCGQCGHYIGQLCCRGADPGSPGGHDLIHRIDRYGQEDHGAGIPHHEAAATRVGRQVGPYRAGRRRLRSHYAPERVRLLPRRPSVRHLQPLADSPLPLRRSHRDDGGSFQGGQVR